MTEKLCPECAEAVKADAKVCRFCGHRFDGSSDQLATDAAAPNQNRGREPVDKAKQNKQGCAVLAVVAVILFGVSKCAGTDGTSGASGNSIAPANIGPSDEDKKTAEKKRQGFHCLSPWDGSSREAVALLEGTLRDPDSLKVTETKITPVNDKGAHLLLMKYRARNGFGGMNIGQAAFTIDNATCAATMIASADK
ncbi:MAG: hypothetical protein OSB00_07745 [Sphingomonas bacterium]|nr:hypothetical protein [Sphingomonas bacterium]